MGAFLARARASCAELDCDYEPVRADEALDRVLLRYLARRERRR
jgi:hypothetical protein